MLRLPRRLVRDRPAIAVLPFSNMSDDPEQDYFSDGISEDIITALSKLRWFLVIARNSSFIYKGKSVDIRQIGEELGVGYILEGSVRKIGERVRITAQLNDVSTGSHVWAERYDRNAADVFAVQDEITEAIVASIEPQLYAAENFHARRKHPNSMDAWELLMRALSHYWLVTRQDNEIAQKLLEQAVAIDPNYGQALGVLATSITFGAHMGWAEIQAVGAAAERTALAAIRADSEDPWAHHALGSFYLITRRFDNSLAEFELALRLNPCFSQAQTNYATALSFCGRWQESLEAVSRALQLSPRDPSAALYFGSASLAHYIGRNYTEATRLARVAIRLRADYAAAYRVLVAAAGMQRARRLPLPPSRSFAARNRIFRWRGSPTTCRSSRTTTATTIWTVFGGPAWNKSPPPAPASAPQTSRAALRLIERLAQRDHRRVDRFVGQLECAVMMRQRLRARRNRPAPSPHPPGSCAGRA